MIDNGEDLVEGMPNWQVRAECDCNGGFVKITNTSGETKYRCLTCWSVYDGSEI